MLTYLKYLKDMNLVKKIVLSILFLGLIAILPVFSLTSKPKVVLFCADWNASCRDIKQDMKSITDKYGDKVGFYELNIDSSDTPDTARELNINVPNKVPYVMIIDKNGNVILQRVININDTQQIDNSINSIISK